MKRGEECVGSGREGEWNWRLRRRWRELETLSMRTATTCTWVVKMREATHTHGGNGISRSFRKGVPKMIWAGKGEAASEGGRGEGSRWPRIHHDAWFTYLAGSRRGTQSANTDKMKLVRRTIRPSPLSSSSSSALSTFLLLSCICIQTVCPLPFSSHRTHVEENRLGE